MENSNGAPSTAGWHDDPEDSNFIRYSNGRTWTGDRVPKDRNLTLKSSNVYRPGGQKRIEDEARAKEKEQQPEPAAYQPMTRRERRALEESTAPKDAPVTVDFESSEFEFESAPPVVSYAEKNKVAKVEEKPVAQPVISSELNRHATLTGFDLGLDKPQKEEPVELPADEDEEVDWAADSALPSLGLDDSDGHWDAQAAITAATGSEPVEADEESGPALPSLGLPVLGGQESDVVDDTQRSTVDDFEDEPFEDEFNFVVSDESPDDDHPASDDEFSSDSESRQVEDDLDFPIVNTPSYAAPAAPSYAAPSAPKKTNQATPAKKESSDHAETKEGSDQAPAEFGFSSKLKRFDTNGEAPAEIVPSDETKSAKAHHGSSAVVPDNEENDDADEDYFEEDESDRGGLGTRFKSLFGRRQKEVLDEYEDDSEDDTDSEDEGDDVVEPERAKPLKSVKTVATPEVIEDDDADDEVDEFSQPQIRAGLFASRKEKEDAAVEGELLGRLKEIADRIAALKKEEVEINSRIKTAKVERDDLESKIVLAHEEHELLDQLAVSRKKELEDHHEEKDDEQFRKFLESHDDHAVETATVPAVRSLPDLVDEPVASTEPEPDDQDPDDDDEFSSAPSGLPTLKLN